MMKWSIKRKAMLSRSGKQIGAFLLAILLAVSLLPGIAGTNLVQAAEKTEQGQREEQRQTDGELEAFAWITMESMSEKQVKADNKKFDKLLSNMTKSDRKHLADLSNYQKAYDITEKQFAKIQKAVEKMTASAKTEQEQVEAIFTWITKHIYYDYDALNGISEGSSNPYRVYTDRKGVCDGYANLFDLCVKMKGIPCLKLDGFTIKGSQSWETVTKFEDGAGETEPGFHAWNAIYTDGAWRYYDVTWGTYNAYRDGEYEEGTTNQTYYALDILTMGKNHIPLTVWSRLPNEGFYYKGTKYAFEQSGHMEKLKIQKLPKKTGKTYTIPASVAGYPTAGFDYFSDIRESKEWKQIQTLILEEGITEVPDHSYREMPALKKVVLPDGLKKIGYSAFYQCGALKTITLPKSVTEIGGFAFASCSSLKKLKFPAKLKKIGEYAFYHTGLTSVKLPDSVTSLGNYAFRECESMKTLTLPSSLKKIPEGIAYWCTGLTSVTLPKKATSVGKAAFYYCKSLTSVKIPNQVTSISSDAFAYCHALQKVTLGKKVEKLASTSFYNCVSLKKLIGTGETPPTVKKGFYLPAATIIQTPAGAQKAYQKAFSVSESVKKNQNTIQEKP